MSQPAPGALGPARPGRHPGRDRGHPRGLGSTVDELAPRLDMPGPGPRDALRTRDIAVETYRESPPAVLGAAAVLVALVIVGVRAASSSGGGSDEQGREIAYRPLGLIGSLVASSFAATLFQLFGKKVARGRRPDGDAERVPAARVLLASALRGAIVAAARRW